MATSGGQVTSMNGGQWMSRGPESTARGYGKVFDEIAAEYDRHRPAYPDELIDQACEVAGIGRGDQVLEVGCGSGQLTRALLARGLRVTAVEPGQNLIALARQNLGGAGAVEFVNAQFEDAPLPREQFRAVFSASAFHWVDPEVSWQKAADVLVPGGTLALVQYFGLEEPRSEEDQQAVLAAMRKVAPDTAANWPAGCVNPIWPHLLRRFLAVVATPDRFGSCDGTPGTGGAAASREAGAVRAADRAGVQQPGGVPDRRDQPADRETVATRPHDHRQGRPEAALFSCDHAGGCGPAGDLGPVPVGAGTGADRRPARGGGRGAGDRGADGPQPVHDQPGAAP